MSMHLSRRRMIAISAAAAGLGLLAPGRAARADAHVVRWQGTALGAVATMQIHHHDRARAERMIERSMREIARLERIFSLFRDDAVLVQLNRRGMCEAPPAELVELLAACRTYAELSDGIFDPTVQPLWQLYAAHFARPDADPAGPPAHQVEAARAKVGLAQVQIGRDRVAFGRRGMALTLNGIAQGYITDRIVDLLRSEGIGHSLVDLGETRALDDRADGSPWQIGIAEPEHPELVGETVPIVDQAVATSGGYGFRFDPAGRFTHLLDPRTGTSPTRYRSVTVIAPTATAADALSTAFSFMTADRIRTAVAQSPMIRAILLPRDGGRLAFGV